VQTPCNKLITSSRKPEKTIKEDVSTLEIKKILQNIIEEEGQEKPLPDDQLAGLLKEKAILLPEEPALLVRRQLDIPVARMRKKI
jgi:RNA polymerase sigma-54 factor